MNWTGQITSSQQGLIIDNETGRSIAVAYDPKHTSIIAAAPDLLNALIQMLDAYDVPSVRQQARTAIDKAIGEQA